jgi:nucleoside-diphosphate-sugar epimerase
MIPTPMTGAGSMSFARTSLVRAHHFGVRLRHRFVRLDPIEGGPRPGLAVTGAGGTIGRILCAGLEDAFEIRAIDEVPGPGVDVVGDVRRIGMTEKAFAGAAAVVDLAAVPRVRAPWPTVRDHNIPTTVAVLEAARHAGVGRVVFASTNHVTGMYERDEPYASLLAGRYEGLDPATVPRIRADWPIRPDSFYAVGKAAGEAAARYYVEEHGLSVICLRIGSVRVHGRPTQPREYATLLTPRDLLQLVRRCIEAPPDLRFGIFYGVSRNTWRIWDIEDATSALGYEPLDDAESFR